MFVASDALRQPSTKKDLRAPMALVTRPEEPKAENFYGMSSSKIVRTNRLI